MNDTWKLVIHCYEYENFLQLSATFRLFLTSKWSLASAGHPLDNGVRSGRLGRLSDSSEIPKSSVENYRLLLKHLVPRYSQHRRPRLWICGRQWNFERRCLESCRSHLEIINSIWCLSRSAIKENATPISGFRFQSITTLERIIIFKQSIFWNKMEIPRENVILD